MSRHTSAAQSLAHHDAAVDMAMDQTPDTAHLMMDTITTTTMNSKMVLEKAGVQTVEECIQRRRNTILPYSKPTDTYERCWSTKKIGSNLLWLKVNYYLVF
jgi:hypothetical protein